MSEENTSQCLFPMVSDYIFMPKNINQSEAFLAAKKLQGSTDDSQEELDSDTLFPVDENEDFSDSDRSVSKYSRIHITNDTF